MTPTSSMIPQVKTRLLELLAEFLPTSHIGYVLPTQTPDQGESVWLGRTDFVWTVPVMRADRQQRDEAATIEVNLSAFGEGRDAADAEARVLVMLAAVEELVASRPQLTRLSGLTLVDPLQIFEHRLDGGNTEAKPIPGGYEGFAQVKYSYTARLS